MLHKGLLCFYSDFFRAAFEGSFKEANEGKIELPDATVDIFETLQVWLYSQSLRNVEDSEDSSKSSEFPSFEILARLWAFGDRYQIPLLQNLAIDALVQKLHDISKFDTIVVKVAYEETMKDSPLRRFAIDCCVFRMCHRLDQDSIFRDSDLCCWSKEAFVDFACCMSDAWERKLPKRKMPDRNKCHYHVHTKGEHC